MKPAAEYFDIKTEPVINTLKALGIGPEAVIKVGGPKFSQIERIKTSRGRNFVGWCLKEGGEPCFVLPVYLQDQIVDLLAFTESWFLLRYGNVFCLGQDQLSTPRIFDEPLNVWRHPIGWFTAPSASVPKGETCPS